MCRHIRPRRREHTRQAKLEYSSTSRQERARHATARMGLSSSLTMLERIADCAPNLLYLYNLTDHRTLYTNRQGACPPAYLSASLYPEDIQRIVEHQEALLHLKANEVLEIEYRMVDDEGGFRWVCSRDTVFARDANGHPAQILGTAHDTTDNHWFQEQIATQISHVNDAYVELEAQRRALAKANRKLQELNLRLIDQATTDGLTGLKNHRAFQEQWQAEFHRSQRYHTPLSLVLLDVDRFKQYNDTFGHPSGDLVLKMVAQILRTSARNSDFVARYGGEEFVVILPETDAEGAYNAAERLRSAIAGAYWPERAITASFGVSTLCPSMHLPSDLLADADRALYRAKQQGRNCVVHAELCAQNPLAPRDATHSFPNYTASGLLTQTDPAVTRPQIDPGLRQVYDATIQGWSQILDLRDSETEGHSERVTHMSVLLARHLGLTDTELMYLRWGALLHDIGKMGIPDDILLKPGPLNEAEWTVMRRHPALAYEMLSPIAFLRPALEIPYCHHEKWDGTGYPRGLKGDEIPLAARIFAVVDVWDALRSDRPYRKGWPEHKIRTYLRAQSGHHFEPSLVNAFLKVLARVKAVPFQVNRRDAA